MLIHTHTHHTYLVILGYYVMDLKLKQLSNCVRVAKHNRPDPLRPFWNVHSKLVIRVEIIHYPAMNQYSPKIQLPCMPNFTYMMIDKSHKLSGPPVVQCIKN